jgi:hypothetical protein
MIDVEQNVPNIATHYGDNYDKIIVKKYNPQLGRAYWELLFWVRGWRLLGFIRIRAHYRQEAHTFEPDVKNSWINYYNMELIDA